MNLRRALLPILLVMALASGSMLPTSLATGNHVGAQPEVPSGVPVSYAPESVDGEPLGELPILPPPPAGAIRVGWVSDAQFEGDRAPLREAVERFRQSGTMMLFYTGDTTYQVSDLPEDWVGALGPYANESRMLFVYGNHDAGSGYEPYMPSEGNATWWATSAGPATVIGLDTNQELYQDSPQFKWLEATLAERADGPVILLMHMPWWVPDDTHPDGPWFTGDAKAMDELVQQHDVDLVLAGHTHYYARQERGGATYVIGGPVDAQTREVPPEVAESAEAWSSQRTSALLDVGPDGVHGRVLDSAGGVIDEFHVEVPAEEANRIEFQDPSPRADDADEADPGLDIDPWAFAGGIAAASVFLYLLPRRAAAKRPSERTDNR